MSNLRLPPPDIASLAAWWPSFEAHSQGADMTRSYTPEEDAQMLELRHRMSRVKIARKMGLTEGQVGGRLERLLARPDERVRSSPARPGAGYPKLWDLPCRAPYAPDQSVPRFAYDEAHVQAVMALGGFPTLAVPHARR